jgi:hypothetical protein
MKYDGAGRDEVVMDLLHTSRTWDLFKIALHFIEIYNTTKLNIPAFYTLLMIMIHPNPEYRPTQLEMKKFNQILLNHETFEAKKTASPFTKQLSKRLASSASV